MKQAISNQVSILYLILSSVRVDVIVRAEHPSQSCPVLCTLSCRCERRLCTPVVFGPYLGLREDVKPPALHTSGTCQQGHLAAATFTDMSAVE